MLTRKGKLILPLIVILLLSLFAGCTGGGTTEATPAPDAGTETETDSGDPAPAPDEGSSDSSAPRADAVVAPASDEEFAFRVFDEPVDVHIGMSVSPIDTTLPEGDSAEDNQYTRYLRDNYNINVIVDWTAAEGNDYNQKVSLSIASDALPDGLIANDQSYMIKAAKSDMLYKIDDLFDQYASTQVKGIMESTNGRARQMASYGGSMVSLPNITVDTDGVHVLLVRKDWLDLYNLDIPRTVDDIEEVAKVFLEQKPAGDMTIPLSGPSKNTYSYCTFLTSSNNNYGFDPVFQAFDAYPGYWLDNGDGTVSYGTTSSNTRDALERLASWYAQGLIDPEMGTRDSSGEPVVANQVGMFFGPWWSLGYGNGDSFKNDPEANWQSYPIYDDNGNWNVHMKNTGTTLTMISKNASEDTAAAIIVMYNALVRDEGLFDTTVAIGWYPIRCVAAAADETEHEYIELQKVLSGETDPEDYNDPMSIYKLLYQDATIVRDVIPGYEAGRDLNVTDFSMENEGDFQRMYALLVGNRPYATTPVDKSVYSVTYSMTDTMEKKWSNLKKMEDEMVLKIITGQSDISAFDTFVTDWNEQGGLEIIAEVEEDYL